ncbi:MAG: UMP kinase [Nitrospirae bacterium]|nr:UMP kinase [Magnetococcales bacterium]HAT51122.1 UMP kinase [Alphaproteobacteria bacterium]
MAKHNFSRILLKMSGEALMRGGDAIDPEFLQGLALDIRAVCAQGVQVAIVVGGGNIFRGLAGSSKGMERTTADHMGMLATVINSLALQSAFERQGVEARVQSAIFMPQVAELYTRNGAVKHLEQGRVVIFAAGTGNPFFTTDTAASLRAAEIGATCLMKATKVDGVYTDDPVRNPQARRLDRLSYDDVWNQRLGVMDMTAITLCRDNQIPILVFSIFQPEALTKIIREEGLYTWIGDDNG